MSRAIAAGVEAGATLGAAGMNLKGVNNTNKSNLQIARETNQSNRDLAAQQNQWNIDQWNRENEYNKPSEQVKRLSDAGMSTAAAVQSVDGAGNAAHLESADLATDQMPAPMQAPQFDLSAIPSIVGTMRELVGLRKDEAEAGKARQENEVWSKLLLTDNDYKASLAAFNKEKLRQSVESFPYTLQGIRYKAEADKLLPDSAKANLEFEKARRAEVDQNVRLARQQFDFLEKQNQQTIDRTFQEIENLKKERDNLIKQGRVLDSQASLIQAQAGLVGEESKNEAKKGKILDEDVYQNRIETILKENGYPDDVASRVGVLIANDIVPLNKVRLGILGTKDYIKEGHKWLNSDPDTRDFLYNYWDKGSQNAQNLGAHTLGYGLHLLDGADKFLDR